MFKKLLFCLLLAGSVLISAYAEQIIPADNPNIKYFGSQYWAYSGALMVGFTAEYKSGELRLDDAEIEDAGWFPADDLPMIPGKLSIARELIDWFVEKNLNKEQPS